MVFVIAISFFLIGISLILSKQNMDKNETDIIANLLAAGTSFLVLGLFIGIIGLFYDTNS